MTDYQAIAGCTIFFSNAITFTVFCLISDHGIGIRYETRIYEYSFEQTGAPPSGPTQRTSTACMLALSWSLLEVSTTPRHQLVFFPALFFFPPARAASTS
jgi:hypothetical protein